MIKSPFYNCKEVFILILIFISATSSLAFGDNTEKIDSLNSITYKARKSNKMNFMKVLLDSTESYLNSISYPKGSARHSLNQGVYYYFLEQYDSVFSKLNKSESIFIENDNYLELGINYKYRGLAYKGMKNFKKAKICFTKAYEYFEDAGNKHEMANNLGNQGMLLGMQSNYSEALDYFVKALEIKLIEGENASAEYNNISIVYNLMGERDKAIQIINKAIDYDRAINDSLSLAGDYNSLAGIYNVSNQLDSSIFWYKKAYDFCFNSHDISLQSAILNNLAEIYLEKKMSDKALEYMHKTKDLHLKNTTNHGFISLGTLSSYYIKTQEWDSALYYSKKVYRQSTSIGEKIYIRQSANNISTIFRNQQKYDSALYYYEIYKKTNDSIYNLEKSKLFSNLQIQLAIQEKETEIKELIQQEKHTRVVIYTMSVIGVLLLIASYLLYRTLKERHKRKQSQLAADKLLLEQKNEHNKIELFNLTFNMLNKNNCLQEVEEELKKSTQDGKELKPAKIIKSIEINRTSDKDWDNFNKYFGVVHEEFFNLLRNEYPDLSTNEIRLCTLLKLHLSKKEIAKILYIEPNSVKVAIYRLKKKFRIGEETKLADFISQL